MARPHRGRPQALTPADRELVLARVDAGESSRAVAASLGVAPNTVAAIVRERRGADIVAQAHAAVIAGVPSAEVRSVLAAAVSPAIADAAMTAVAEQIEAQTEATGALREMAAQLRKIARDVQCGNMRPDAARAATVAIELAAKLTQIAAPADKSAPVDVAELRRLIRGD